MLSGELRAAAKKVLRHSGSYLPAKLATDSAFPYELPARVKVSIIEGRLVVEKVSG